MNLFIFWTREQVPIEECVEMPIESLLMIIAFTFMVVVVPAWIMDKFD